MNRVCCVFAVLAVVCEAFATKYAPPGYVEYVDTDWYSYVDTGVVPNSRTRVVYKFQRLAGASGAMLNGYQAGGDAKPQFTFGIDGQDKFVSVVAAKQKGAKRTIGEADFEVHTFDLRSGSQKFDGAEYATDTIDDSATESLLLFAMRNGWFDGEAYYACSFRLYGCEIYDGETLIRRYRPYWDGVKGVIRDEVSGKEAETVGINRFRYPIPTLPAEIPCVEMVGDVGLDTGVIPSLGTRVVFKFALSALSGGAQLCGYQAGANNKPQFSWGATKAGRFVSVVAAQQQGKMRDTGVACDLAVHTFDLRSGAQTFDGTEYATDTIDDSAANSMYLFAMRNEWPGSEFYYCRFRFYGCQIYEGGELIRDYRPYFDGTNAVIRDFAVNAGTNCTLFGTGSLRIDSASAKKASFVDGLLLNMSEGLMTGVTPTANTRIVYDFAYRAIPGNTQYLGWMGGTMKSGVFVAGISVKNGKSDFVSWVASTQETEVGPGQRILATADTARHVIDIRSGSQKIDGREMATDEFLGVSGLHPINIFAMNNEWSGGAMYNLGCEFYGCQIYEGDELIRDYRPAISQFGQAIVYDQVARQVVYVSGFPTCFGKPHNPGFMLFVK